MTTENSGAPNPQSLLAELRARAEQAEAGAAAMREALDLAWGLIANANGGDWTLATPEWRAAAERWRDECYSKKDTDAGLTPKDADFARVTTRLLRAAQSLHRAWRRERDDAQHEREVRGADTCAYCLKPLGPPSGIEEGAERYRAHALVCEKHPAFAAQRALAATTQQRDVAREALGRLAGVAQALLERMDMDAGLGLLRFQTHEWSERVDNLRRALREVKP